MSYAENIKVLRKQNNLSQEKFAEILEITRQAVQKWEAGTAMPDLYNLCTISKKFNVSVDSLILDSNSRTIDNLEYDKTIQPEYSAIHRWENYPEQILLEYRQSVEEGKDIEEYKDMFHALQKMRPGKNKSDIADILFRIVLNAPVVQGYEYLEPSEFEMIKASRKPYGTDLTGIDKQALRDKITGAWTGRICGCLLGKVVEGVRTDKLIPFLKETGNFPMHRYILTSDITDKIQEKYTLRLNRNNCADQITCAPADDDTNYTVLAQIIVDKYGRDFTSYNISRAWMDYQPKNAYCTAERVAFRNFVAGFVPPQSAEYKIPTGNGLVHKYAATISDISIRVTRRLPPKWHGVMLPFHTRKTVFTARCLRRQ